MKYKVLVVFLYFFCCTGVFCEDNFTDNINLNKNVNEDVLDDSKIDNTQNNVDLAKVNEIEENVDSKKNNEINTDFDSKDNSTMYRKLYDNIELSDEERKLIDVEVDSRTYKKTDAKYLTFYDIKYGSLRFKDIGNVNIVSADLFSVMQRNFFTYQNLGLDGSNAFSLFPRKIKNIGTSFGYTGYDIYKTDDEDLIFFDTKMPLGDLRVSFDLDSGTGFFFKVNTYISANKNFHFGISVDSVLRRRILSNLSANKYSLAIINFPISSYFLYKSTNEKILSLVNFTFGNYIHSDHGGTYIDGNPNFINENDIQDVFDNVVKKHCMDIDLLFYFQYKTKYPYLYFQYNFGCKEIKTDINNEFEEVRDDIDGKINLKLSDKKIKNSFFEKVLYKKYESDCYALLNKDTYIENSFEIGVKDIVEVRRHLEFNYNVFYIFKFSTRASKSKFYSTREFSSSKTNKLIDRKWYFDPVSLGANLSFFGIRLSPLLTFSGKKLYFKIALDYKMKYFSFDIVLSRSKVPLIFTEYGFFDKNYRYYNIEFNEKVPFNLYFDIKGDINIKNIVEIKPMVLCDFTWNKMFFKYRRNDLGKLISQPSQNENVLLHISPSIKFKVLFLKYFNIDLLPIVNIKKILGSNINVLKNENKKNIPVFSIYLKTYYHHNFIKHNVELCTGLECFWRTNYYPNNFDPISQQFFNQPSENEIDKFKVVTKPNVSAFFNFRFGNFVGSFKINLIDIFWDAYSFAAKNYPNNNEYYMFSIQYLMF